jgi:hypothetical protein
MLKKTNQNSNSYETMIDISWIVLFETKWSMQRVTMIDSAINVIRMAKKSTFLICFKHFFIVNSVDTKLHSWYFKCVTIQSQYRNGVKETSIFHYKNNFIVITNLNIFSGYKQKTITSVAIDHIEGIPHHNSLSHEWCKFKSNSSSWCLSDT